MTRYIVRACYTCSCVEHTNPQQVMWEYIFECNYKCTFKKFKKLKKPISSRKKNYQRDTAASIAGKAFSFQFSSHLFRPRRLLLYLARSAKP